MTHSTITAETLTALEGDKFRIGRDVQMTIIRIDEDRVRLGFNAPRHIRIMRTELLRRKELETVSSSPAAKSADQPRVGHDGKRGAA